MEHLKKKAISLFNEKNYEKSLNIFLSILEKEPLSINVLLFTSYNYMQIGNFEKALTYLDKIIQINEKLPEVFYNRGICFNVLGRSKEAIDNFTKAISLKSDYFEAYIQLGQLLKKLNLYNETIKIYKIALPRVTQKDSINVNISEIYYLQKDFELSIKYAEDALRLNSENYFAHINLANCLMDQGEVERGIIELEKAKKINSNSSMIYNNLGYGYKISGKDNEATINYNKAISLDPNLSDAYFNLSHIQLANNNFKDGWKNYEYRFGVQNKFTHQLKFKKPKWEIEYGFRRILIWGEQAIGEQILFSSILSDVIPKFEKVILCINDKLLNLIQRKFNNLEVYPLSKKIDENKFDYHLPICSLAKYFRNNIESFPDIVDKPFLKDQRISNEKLRCALSWKSSNLRLGEFKSIMLEDMKEILLINKIEFFNIQYTDEDNEVREFEKKYNVSIHKDEELDTFNNLTGLSDFINSCDFVITVSNSNAHLSAFLGKPTYLLLPKNRGQFWYWENDKSGINLWYPAVTKFKQEKQGDWSKPIDNLKNFILKKYI